MKNLYENYVLEYDIENSIFGKFCKNASREEFAKSQQGFYYAVEAFPQMLCFLASTIKNPQVRLKVVENIWEEHGQGNSSNFHTSTFKNYLRVLGAKEIKPNFFVDSWVTKLMEKNDSPENYAAYLAGVEFIYTKISHLICETLESFGLNNNQHHYKTHEVLDFTHAMDLLDVSFALTQEQHYLEDCSNAVFANFVNGVKDLVDVFNQLSFLTEKEVQKISQDKIAFYYSREDSKIELKYSEDYMNILIVGSGGEHIINLKNTLPHTEITALDINPHQLKLVKDKVDACNQLTKSNKDTKVNQNNKINKNIQDNVFQAHGGKFEGLFNYLAQKLSSEDIKNIQEDNIFSLKKLQLICQDVFSNKNLNQVFTEEATKYSSENFSDHFYKVFVQKIKELDANPSNMNSILSRTLPMNYPKEMELEGINYYCGDFVSHFNEKITNENHMVLLNAALDNALSIQANEEMEPVLNADKYNMISISNVGDWMPQEQFKSLLDKAKEHLIPNGVVIARKLLGDYSLKDLMLSRFSKVIQEKDNTGFYTECYVGVM